MHVKILLRFSPREKADSCSGSKTLADENSLVIDLALMTDEDYAFPLPEQSHIALCRSQKTSFRC